MVATSPTFTLDAAGYPLSQTIEDAAAATQPRPRALLVDDERSVLSSLSRLLRRHGFDADVETDPIAALARLNDVPFDVIVADFNMPHMNGAQFLREAKRRAPGCTRILLSGQADRDAVIDAVNDGAVYRYLDKPWDAPTLIQALNEAVDLTRDKKRLRARRVLLEHSNASLKVRMKTQSAALNQAWYHDIDTGLANRVLLLDSLQKRISQGFGANRQIAIVALELDRLPRVSASLGQAAATEVVREIANRLSGHVRDGDIVAQLGKTTLAVVFAVADGEDKVRAVAARLLGELVQPCTTSFGTVMVSGNLGISLCPRDGQQAASLVNNAEASLQQIPAGETGLLRFFCAELQVRERHQFNLESDLRVAVQQRAFHLHYQPRVAAASGKILGAEALLRWNHPHYGSISPTDFIPLLERTGLIVEVGQWVLEEAARSLARWRILGREDLRLSVNVPSLQFRRCDLAVVVRKAMDDQGEKLRDGRLELELTESLFLGEHNEDQQVLAELTRAGVPLAIDDFGTGYSSFSYLINKPLNVLKIDRSFVSLLDTDQHAVKVVQAIIAMSHALDMAVVAEGVETETQRQALVGFLCDELQGFLIAKPQPEADFLKLLI